MTDVDRRAPLLDSAAAFASLTAVLWNTREAVEHVLFAVVKERLILEAPAYRWLGKADDELRAALRGLHANEDDRVIAIGTICADLRVSPTCTLAELLAVSPEPWPTVLAEHRLELRTLVHDLDEPVAAVLRLLRASSLAVRETLHDIDKEAQAGPDSRDPADEVRAVDRAMLVTAADANQQNALETTAWLVRLSLFEFLA